MGVSMRCRLLSIILFLVLLIGIIAPAWANPWSGGYRIALDGYDSHAFTRSEHLHLSMIYEPFGAVATHPQLQLGVTVSTDGDLWTVPLVTMGVGTGLFVFQEHPFSRMFRRDSALIPKIEATLTYNPIGSGLVAGTFLLQPISFHYGDKYIGIAGIAAVRDFTTNTWGWGVRLFEISHYLW
jgi:hypothetical protein